MTRGRTHVLVSEETRGTRLEGERTVLMSKGQGNPDGRKDVGSR